MKEFLDFYTVRNNAMLTAGRILSDGFFPDIVYMLLRGGSVTGNVFIEYFRIAGYPVKTAAAVAESYAGVRRPEAALRLSGWTCDPASLKEGSRVLLVDDIFDSGRTVNRVAEEIVNAGVGRENLKIAVHDYKIRHFDSRQKALPFHPDYYARKFEIFSEADDVWIHYLSHELEGLTAEEKEEQARLRQDYINSVRANLRAQLNNINIQNEDGSVTNLGEEHAAKGSGHAQ